MTWEKAMAPHSSTLAWKIPWTEEAGRLQSVESNTAERIHFHFHFSFPCIQKVSVLLNFCLSFSYSSIFYFRGISATHGQRSLVGCSPWGRYSRTRLSDFTFTFHFHALEKEMATHSSVLACRIPGMGKPGGLPSMGSHRVGHN